MSQIQAVQNWGTDIAATGASGAVFTPLPSHDCDEVQLIIPAALALSIDIQVQSNPPVYSTQIVTIDSPSGLVIQVTGNSLEIGVRRNDQSNTPASFGFIWRKYRRG